MRKSRVILSALLVLAVCSLQAMAQTNKPSNPAAPPAKATKAMSNLSSADVVKGFFGAFGKGDVEGVVNSFHEKATIVAVRKGDRKGNHYGNYAGREGARAFVTVLGKTFDTQAFAVDHVIGEGNVAFASGSFTHKLKTTGKLFTSDWALKCIVENGKILEYHFYEDSEAFRDAGK
jgi:ketosteroid isomerase-like protein